ncbi:MAG: hypothetical protein ACKO37_10075, partial [Vampirovibrionales bacterium]
VQRARTMLNRSEDKTPNVLLNDAKGKPVTTESGKNFAFEPTKGTLKAPNDPNPKTHIVFSFSYDQKLPRTGTAESPQFEKRTVQFDQSLYQRILDTKTLPDTEKKAIARILDGNQTLNKHGKLKNIKNPVASSAWAAQYTPEKDNALSGLLINARHAKKDNTVGHAKGGLFITQDKDHKTRVFIRPDEKAPLEELLETPKVSPETTTQADTSSTGTPLNTPKTFQVPTNIQTQDKTLTLPKGLNTLVQDPSDSRSKFQVNVNDEGTVEKASFNLDNGKVGVERPGTRPTYRDEYSFSVNTQDPNKPQYEVYKNGTKLNDLSDSQKLARTEDEVLTQTPEGKQTVLRYLDTGNQKFAYQIESPEYTYTLTPQGKGYQVGLYANKDAVTDATLEPPELRQHLLGLPVEDTRIEGDY